jgi:deoxyribonuclease V
MRAIFSTCFFNSLERFRWFRLPLQPLLSSANLINMLIATDIYYYDDKAKAVALTFENWTDEQAGPVFSCILDDVAAYEPGAFYKRELPGILEVLKQIDLSGAKAIVIDGYVVLDDAGKPGLGARLYEALGERIPVIGVAKTRFADNTRYVVEVLRGSSLRPLYVTAIGTDLHTAAEQIRNMAGAHRMPALLKEADRVSKN